jgi:hypothetical protein
VTPIAIAIIDLLGLAIIVWMLNLVRRGHLYIGYAVIGLLATAIGITAVSFARFLPWLGIQLGLLGFVGMGFAVVALMLVYVLSQLSILSNRLATLVQELAIERGGKRPADRDE